MRHVVVSFLHTYYQAYQATKQQVQKPCLSGTTINNGESDYVGDGCERNIEQVKYQRSKINLPSADAPPDCARATVSRHAETIARLINKL